MATNLAVAQRAQYFDNDGNPLSGGRLTFMEVGGGTTLPKSIFADPGLVVELSNPLVLDIGGFVPESGVFYGPGNYKLLVEKLVNPGSVTPLWAEEYTVPVIIGGDSSVTSSPTPLSIDTVLELGDIDIASGSKTAIVQGYYAKYDGGGGKFNWSPSSVAPIDGGYIIGSNLSSTGRWIRIFDDATVTTAQFGVIEGAGTSMGSRMAAAALFASGEGFDLVISPGQIACTGNVTVDVRGKIIVSDDFKLIRYDNMLETKLILIAAIIEVQGLTSKVSWPANQTKMQLRAGAQLDIHPEWFGSIGNGTTDDFIPLFYASESSALSLNSPVVLTYQYLSSGNGSQPSLTFPNLICKDGSRIINSSYAWFLTGKVDVQGEKAFGGNIGRYYCDMDPMAHWFIDTTPTEGEMVDMCESVTRNGTKKGSLVWDSRSYTLPNCADSAVMQLVTHSLVNNAKWTAGGTDLAKTFQMANTEIPLSWFDKAVELQQALYYAKRNNALLDCHFNTYTITAPLSLAGSATTSGGKVFLKNVNIICSGISQAINFGADYVHLRNVTIAGGYLTAFGADLDWEDCYFQAPTTVDFLLQAEFSGVAKGKIVKCVFAGYQIIDINRANMVIRNCEFNNVGNRMKFTGGDTLSVIEQNSFGNVPFRGPPTNPDSFAVQLITPNNMRFNGNTFTLANLFQESVSGVVIMGMGGVVSNLTMKDNYFALSQAPAYVTNNNWQMIAAMGCAATGHRAVIKDNHANHPYPRTIPAMSGSDGSTQASYWETNILYESMCFGTEAFNNKTAGAVPNAVIKSFYKCLLPWSTQPKSLSRSEYRMDDLSPVLEGDFSLETIVAAGGTYTCSSSSAYQSSYTNPIRLSTSINVEAP